MSKFLEFKVDLDNFITNLSALLDANNKQIEKLLEIDNKTYTNFVKPMQMMDEYLEQFFTPLSHLNSVNNSDETQKYMQILCLLSLNTQQNYLKI